MLRITLAYLPTCQECNATQLLPALEERGIKAEALRLVHAVGRTPHGWKAPDAGPARTLSINPQGGLYLAHYFTAVYSHADLVITVGGGLDPTPQIVEQMLQQVEQGADVVIASRYNRNSQVRYPWRRLLVSKVYSRVVSLLFGLGTTDSRSGLKLYQREKLIEALKFSPPQRVAFDVELLATIRRLGATVIEIPASAVYTQSPYTWTWADIRQGVADTLRLFYNLRVRRLFSRRR
ncbi:MAG: hypothetical protein EXR55_04430 [Dehalococcoidia bacterium]|nr:hypothetical protein [Dehalococcoidia bacterium]